MGPRPRCAIVFLLATSCGPEASGITSDSPHPRVSATAATPPPSATASAVARDAPSAVVSAGATALAGPTEIPALYAALFVEGRTWRIQGRQSHTHMEEHGPVKDSAAFIANCVVREVTRASWGAASVVRCSDLPDVGTRAYLDGTWYATARGLLHDEGAPRDDGPPDDASRVFALPIGPADETTVDPATPDFGMKRRVFALGATWCYAHEDWGGDSAWSEVCLAPSEGFVSGKYGWSGGSSHEVVFTRK